MGWQPREYQLVQEAPARRGFTIVRRVGELWARVSGMWGELKPALALPRTSGAWAQSGEGAQDTQGVEFLDPANSGDYLIVSFLLQGTVV